MCCTIFLPGCHRQQQRYPTRIPRVAPRVQDCRPGPAHTKDGTFRGILSGINSSGNVSFVITFLQWGGLGPRIEPGTGGLEEGTLTTRPPHFHHKLTSRFTKEGKKRYCDPGTSGAGSQRFLRNWGVTRIFLPPGWCGKMSSRK